jgi:hypothetical protein
MGIPWNTDYDKITPTQMRTIPCFSEFLYYFLQYVMKLILSAIRLACLQLDLVI